MIGHLFDREAINDERGIGTVMIDGLGIGATHITIGPPDAGFLLFAQAFVKDAMHDN